MAQNFGEIKNWRFEVKKNVFKKEKKKSNAFEHTNTPEYISISSIEWKKNDVTLYSTTSTRV